MVILCCAGGKVTWADHIDLATGRPVEAPNIRYEHGASELWPGNLGLHNWPPMSFSPRTGLVYIPTIESGGRMSDEGIDAREWKSVPGQFNSGLGPNYGGGIEPTATTALLAWDPVHRRVVWRAATPVPWNGGTLATAGGLVFQGHIDGNFTAYDAVTGKQLWSYPVGNAILGAPISYRVGGRQYVSVVSAPPAGALVQLDGANSYGWSYRDHPARLLTFTLDGSAKIPALPRPAGEKPLHDPSFVVDAKLAATGSVLYYGCGACHGGAVRSMGSAPDLRASAVALSPEAFAKVVRGGTLTARGMPQFAELTDADLTALRHYIRAEADRATSASP